MLAGLRAALRDPLLLRLAMAEKLCSMADEIFLGFAALYLQDARHVNAPTVGYQDAPAQCRRLLPWASRLRSLCRWWLASLPSNGGFRLRLVVWLRWASCCLPLAGKRAGEGHYERIVVSLIILLR